jgi:hypothetical protein
LTVGTFGTGGVAIAVVAVGAGLTMTASIGNATNSGDWGSVITSGLFVGSALRGAAGDGDLAGEAAAADVAEVQKHLDLVEEAQANAFNPVGVYKHVRNGINDEYLITTYSHDGVTSTRTVYKGVSKVHGLSDDNDEYIDWQSQTDEFAAGTFPSSGLTVEGTLIKHHEFALDNHTVKSIMDSPSYRPDTAPQMEIYSRELFGPDELSAEVNDVAVAAVRHRMYDEMGAAVEDEIQAELDRYRAEISDSSTSSTTSIVEQQDTGAPIWGVNTSKVLKPILMSIASKRSVENVIDEVLAIADGTSANSAAVRSLLSNPRGFSKYLNYMKVAQALWSSKAAFEGTFSASWDLLMSTGPAVKQYMKSVFDRFKIWS